MTYEQYRQHMTDYSRRSAVMSFVQTRNPDFIALTEAKRLGYAGRTVEARLDSKLVGEQLSGNWKIKEPSLKPQWAKVRMIIEESFPSIKFVYVPRAQTAEADRLVNEAIDEAGF